MAEHTYKIIIEKKITVNLSVFEEDSVRADNFYAALKYSNIVMNLTNIHLQELLDCFASTHFLEYTYKAVYMTLHFTLTIERV